MLQNVLGADQCANLRTPVVTLRVTEVPSSSTAVYRSPQLAFSSAGYQQLTGVRVSVVASGQLAAPGPHFAVLHVCVVLFVVFAARRLVDCLVWCPAVAVKCSRRAAQAGSLAGCLSDGVVVSRGQGDEDQTVWYTRLWWYTFACCSGGRGVVCGGGGGAGADDDNGVAWGETGYRYKPLELKEFTTELRVKQLRLERVKRQRRLVKSFARINSDPVFYSTRGAGWQRPLRPHQGASSGGSGASSGSSSGSSSSSSSSSTVVVSPVVAKVLLEECRLPSEEKERNAVVMLQRELRRVLSRRAAVSNSHDHVSRQDIGRTHRGGVAPAGRSRSQQEQHRRRMEAAFTSRNPNPQSLGAGLRAGSGSVGGGGEADGGAGVLPSDASLATALEIEQIEHAFSPLPPTMAAGAQIQQRLKLVSGQLRSLYESLAQFEVDAPSADAFSGKLNQCIRDDVKAGLVPSRRLLPDQALRRRALAMDTALSLLLQGQRNPHDNVLRLVLLEWWEGHRPLREHILATLDKERIAQRDRENAEHNAGEDVTRGGTNANIDTISTNTNTNANTSSTIPAAAAAAATTITTTTTTGGGGSKESREGSRNRNNNSNSNTSNNNSSNNRAPHYDTKVGRGSGVAATR